MEFRLRIARITALILTLSSCELAWGNLGDQESSVPKIAHQTTRAVGGHDFEFDTNGAHIKISSNPQGKICEVTSVGPNAHAYIQNFLNSAHQAEFQLPHTDARVRATISRRSSRFLSTRETPHLRIRINNQIAIRRITVQLRDADCPQGDSP